MKRFILIAALAVVALAVIWGVQRGSSATSAVVSDTKQQIPDDEMIPSPASGAGFETGQEGRLRYGEGQADGVGLSERIPLPEPTLPELTAQMVPAHLHPLFGWESIGGYVPRRRMVEALGQDLSGDEVRSLMMFVRAKPAEVSLSESDFNGVGDVVLLKLEAQKALHPDYSDHLAVMFYDQALNATWRDYCIQHLGTVHARIPEEKHPVIRQLYLDALEPGSSFAGTTLLSMKRSAGTPDLPKEFVAEKAMAVASSDAYGDAERLSALHVAAEFNHPDAVELARQIAASRYTTQFRAAALAVIGAVGEETDRPLLEKYVKSSDIRLRVAAAEGLKRINHGTPSVAEPQLKSLSADERR